MKERKKEIERVRQRDGKKEMDKESKGEWGRKR